MNLTPEQLRRLERIAADGLWERLKFAIGGVLIFGGCFFVLWSLGRVAYFPPPWSLWKAWAIFMVAVPSAIAIWGFFDGLISADPAVRARQVSILLVLEVIVISVLMGACILVLERLVK